MQEKYMWKYFKSSIEEDLLREGINIHSPRYKESENYKRIAGKNNRT